MDTSKSLYDFGSSPFIPNSSSLIRKKHKNKRKVYLFLSLAIHSLVIFIIAVQIMPVHQENEQAVLKTYLYAPPKPIIQPEPPPALINKELTVQIPQVETAKPIEDIKQNDSPLESNQALNEQKKNNQAIQEELVLENQNVEKDIVKQETNNQVANTPKASLAIKQAIQEQYFANKNQELSENSAKEYRRLKTSPLITTEGKTNTWDKKMERPEISVACNSNTQKSLVFISSLTGGTLRCQDNSNFQMYIDKHLNKTPEEDKNN